MASATSIEQPVRNEWRALPYAAYGVCSNPLCATLTHLHGNSPTTRICIDCFEFVYNCHAPRRAS